MSAKSHEGIAYEIWASSRRHVITADARFALLPRRDAPLGLGQALATLNAIVRYGASICQSSRNSRFEWLRHG